VIWLCWKLTLCGRIYKNLVLLALIKAHLATRCRVTCCCVVHRLQLGRAGNDIHEESRPVFMTQVGPAVAKRVECVDLPGLIHSLRLQNVYVCV